MAVLLLPLATLSAGPFVFTPLPGVVVLAGAIGGPVGLLWATLGSGVGHAIAGTPIGIGVVVGLVGYIVLGTTFNVFWTSRVDEEETGSWAHFVVVLTTASFATGSVTALGFVVAGELPFFPFSITVAVESVVSTAVVFGLALVVSQSRDSDIPCDGASGWQFGPSRPQLPATLGVGAAFLIWQVTGTGVSLVYQTVELVPTVEFSARGLGVFEPLVQSGRVDQLRVAVQSGLGVMILVFVGRWYHRRTVLEVSSDE